MRRPLKAVSCWQGERRGNCCCRSAACLHNSGQRGSAGDTAFHHTEQPAESVVRESRLITRFSEHDVRPVLNRTLHYFRRQCQLCDSGCESDKGAPGYLAGFHSAGTQRSHNQPCPFNVGQQGWETLNRNISTSESCFGVLPDPELKLFITHIVM